MRIVWTLLPLLLACVPLPVAAAPSPAPIAYRVTPVIGEDGLEALAIELRLSGDADGITRITLPNQWAGADKLYRHIDAIEVIGGTRLQGPPEAMDIRAAPGAALTLRYRVKSAYAEAPSLSYDKGRPTLLADNLFAYGESLFATPEGRDEAPARVTLDPFPPAWHLATDLQHDQAKLTVSGVVESIFIAGHALRVIERPRGNAPLRIAILGQWAFSDEVLADHIERVLAAEDRAWGDAPLPFLVPVYPLTGGESGRISINGTGRGDAFAISGSTNVTLAMLDHLLAHEYAHHWSPGQLGKLHEPEALDYWLAEGFTDWLAARGLIDAGLWTPADFASSLNETLLRNATSSARTLPNAEVGPRFWKDDAVMQVSYDRGFLLALGWDEALRAKGSDFATVLHDMRSLATRGGYATDHFLTAMRAAGVDPAPDVAAFVERGTPIALAPNILGPCGRVIDASQPGYARGFELDESGPIIHITTVDQASPAFAAGIRTGMRFVKREGGRRGDATQPYVARIAEADGSSERSVSFLPAGRDTISFQRLDLTPRSDAACRARLAGGALPLHNALPRP